jgi:hypothetical protein
MVYVEDIVVEALATAFYLLTQANTFFFNNRSSSGLYYKRVTIVIYHRNDSGL